MKEYTFFWLDGKTTLSKGGSPREALNNAGYGAGAVRALDFYTEGDARKEYEWKLDEILKRNKWHKLTIN